MRHIAILILFLTFFNRSQTFQDECLIDVADELFQQKIDNFIPEMFYIQNLHYKVDACFDPVQFDYLTGLKSEKNHCKKDLINALFYLQQSEEFCKIQLKILKKEEGFYLEFQLIKSPVLHRISISGFLRGKQRLKNNYLLDIGEKFDQQKHQHSLQQIYNVLRSDGYFHAKISDSIIIDPKTKGVKVSCRVKKGIKFQIQNIEIVFDSIGTVCEDEIRKMKHGIDDLCYQKVVGKYYCAAQVENLEQKIKRYLQYHGCIDFDVTVQQKILDEIQKVNLIIHICVERKREFVFWGSTFFTREQLMEQLLLYGKSTWHFPSALIIDEIEQLYKNNGFWNVQVSIKEEQDRVFCFIHEGQRVIINSIQCKNNKHVVQTASSKRAYAYLLKMKYFDRDLFKKFLDQILKDYRQAGFWDVKILKEEFIADKKEHAYNAFITLDEGSKRVFGSVAIPGYQDIEQQLQTQFSLYKNQGFEATLLQEQKQWIVRYLHGKGYQKVVVDHMLKEDQGIVHIIWNVALAESVMKIGKTVIVGNAQIPHALLMKECAYNYGDEWDKAKIESTLQNLRSLSVFDSVYLYPSKDVDQDLYKPIFIKLIESDRYEIRTRFGLQQMGKNLQFRRGFTYKVGATLGIINPFQVADRCLIDADITRFYRNIAASYEFPWLFERKIRCQLKLYDSEYNQPVYIGSQYSLYKATQQGFLWSMTHAHPTSKYGDFTFNSSVGLEFMGLYEADQPRLPSIIDYDLQLISKKTAYVFVEPTALWQKVDCLLNPHKGHMTFMSCKGMFDLDSKTSFLKILLEHSLYFSCTEMCTIAFKARCGHVFNRCFEQIHPIERFYLGGASSIRGYERDYCPPFGLLTDPIYDQHAGLPSCANDYWKYAPQGGRTLFNANAEVRCRVYKNFGVVLFNDIGALFKHSIYDEIKSGWDNFFGGSGMGIRYDTPIGPLRFDVGFKWKILHPDFESRCVWYLTIGQAF